MLGLGDRLRAATEEAAALTGTGPAALVALADLADAGTVDRLRRALALTPSGAVRLVDRLAADGLLERRPGPDGRSLSLVLTTAGRAAAASVHDARAGAVAGLLAGLDAEDRQALQRVVDRLVAGLVDDRLAQRAAGSEPPGGWLCRLCDVEACGRRTGSCPAATAAQDGGPRGQR